jgi:hypothetical protein
MSDEKKPVDSHKHPAAHKAADKAADKPADKTAAPKAETHKTAHAAKPPIAPAKHGEEEAAPAPVNPAEAVEPAEGEVQAPLPPVLQPEVPQPEAPASDQSLTGSYITHSAGHTIPARVIGGE